MNPVTHFGTWLKEQIADRGISQRQFADTARIPVNTLAYWISRPCPPMRLASIARIAIALGTTRQDLQGKLEEARAAQSEVIVAA